MTSARSKLAQRLGDAREGRRENAAPGDIHDVMAPSFGEEPDRAVGSDDELGARPVAHDGLRRTHGPGRRVSQRGVPGQRVRNPAPLERELLVVREVEDRAAAAAVGVIAVDSLGGQ